jgi:hypothetical protein
MTPDANVLFPDREFMVGEEKVTVREMLWPDALAFLRKLGTYLEKFMNEKGEMRVDLGLITEVITATDELATMLIAKSIGKDEAWLAALSMSQGLEILGAALEVNLTEDLLEKGKKIAGFLQTFADAGMRVAKPASERSTSS